MRLLYFFKSDTYQLSISVNDALTFLYEKGFKEAAEELTKRANAAEKLIDKRREKREKETQTWTSRYSLNDEPEKVIGESKNWWQRLFS